MPLARSSPHSISASISFATTVSVTSAILEPELLGDHHALHLVRAFPDLEDLLVTVEARDREFLHEPIAAVDLERGVHGTVGEKPRVELRLGRGESERSSRVLEPRRPVDELSSGLDLGRHVGELELDRLEARDRLPELMS